MGARASNRRRHYRHVSRRGDAWVHIDRFDKRSRAVWAIQYFTYRGRGRAVWRTAIEVHIRGAVESVAHFGADTRQPRAYLVVRGPVRVSWNSRMTVATITGPAGAGIK